MMERLEEMLDKMPGEGASEEEIEAFMEKVMEEPGGLAMIKELAEKIAGAGAGPGESDESLALQSPIRLIFRVELLGTEPLVWRRFSLPADATFFHLHHAIQDAFGWRNCGGHRFEVWEEGRCEVTFGPEAGGGPDEYGEKENRIHDLFREQVGEFLYLYDFDDDWRHRVVAEEIVGAGTAGTSKETVPKLHGGEGHGPPEGCGGVAGFAAFLRGEHPLCDQYEAEVLEEFRKGQPDLAKVVFRVPGRPGFVG